MVRTISLAMSLALITSSCVNRDSSTNQTSLISGKYFSMRQQTPADYFGIIQLKSPALLSTAKNVDGKIVINEELKEIIEIEQLNVINKLKSISPEIEIISTYKMVLNAISFVAPSTVEKDILKVEGVGRIVENTLFNRPTKLETEQQLSTALKLINEKNSVNFIGADKLHKKGITGTKRTVGIIDTGIDYTHVMMGGAGSKELYDSIDPVMPNQYFPNDKVIGGVDFVGSNYSPSSDKFEYTIPRRDENPIDESGHGTHVAGSVAGIGDGIYSYNGVAPDAKLYALKVFGKDGGTSDIAVIQALEYAADPFEKMNPNNRLDVVNLSLGGSNGKPKVLYSEAIENLVKAGTIVVASSGNSGDTPYITGAPATSDDAISVGASIDDMPHNIEVESVLALVSGEEIVEERLDSNGSIPSKNTNVSAEVVYIGNTVDEISPELQEKVKGKIALIDRGVNSFEEKLNRAEELDVIGVVVANNVEGPANVMNTGESKFNFPAVSITKGFGDKIKVALNSGESVLFTFNSDRIIERKDLIDTMTSFSSRGPRTMDSLIKPEISGPGYQIVSALSGTGNKYEAQSGTSMSAPHLAGVMALLREAFPNESVATLKARILNTAKILKNADGTHVPVARQGAGRVQTDKAFESKAYALPATLSLGEISVAGVKRVAKKVTIKNTSNEDLVYSATSIQSKNIKVSMQNSFRVKANSTFTFPISFTIEREDPSKNNVEVDGFVILRNTKDSSEISLPFLAVLNKVSNIKAGQLLTHTVSSADKENAEVTLKLRNDSYSSGDALIFNLLGRDGKKEHFNPKLASANTSCDLEAAGIRVVEKDVEGENQSFLQFGIKLYDNLTNWMPCDVSVQFDFDSDGVTDQELVGIRANYIPGIGSSQYASILLDAKLAKAIRLNYEQDPENEQQNYMAAVQSASPMYFYNHSNVAMIEVPVEAIQRNKKNEVGIKLAITHLQGDYDIDDFLADHETNWSKINLTSNAFAFNEIPEVVTVDAHDQQAISMKRGKLDGELLVLYPHNTPNMIEDKQSAIIKEQFLK